MKPDHVLQYGTRVPTIARRWTIPLPVSRPNGLTVPCRHTAKGSSPRPTSIPAIMPRQVVPKPQRPVTLFADHRRRKDRKGAVRCQRSRRSSLLSGHSIE